MQYENDLSLTRNLAQESANRATFLRSLTTRNILFGSAALAAAVGVGAAACIWAWNQGLDPKDLQAALEHMPTLKVEQVKLDKDATVKLDPNATVKLIADPLSGSVKLETVPLTGTVTLDAGVLRQIIENAKPVMPDMPKQPDRTSKGEAIKREVTVFSEVAHGGNGRVVTGWKYHDGESATPYEQFCYFGEPAGNAGEEAIVHMGKDNTLFPSVARNKVPSFSTAWSKCQWFTGSLTKADTGPNKKRKG